MNTQTAIAVCCLVYCYLTYNLVSQAAHNLLTFLTFDTAWTKNQAVFVFKVH